MFAKTIAISISNTASQYYGSTPLVYRVKLEPYSCCCLTYVYIRPITLSSLLMTSTTTIFRISQSCFQVSTKNFVSTWLSGIIHFLFERSEFLIAIFKKNKTDCVCGCSADVGFSARSANRIRPKHGIPLSV